MNLNSKVRVQIHELQVQIHELRVQIHELRVQIHEFKNHLINENSSKQPWNFNSLKISSFLKILCLKIVRQFVRELVLSVSGDNLVFYFFTISWLRLQQEAMWVNINFERRDLTSTQKSHSVPDDLNVQLRTYLIDGPFFNRKKIYKDIRISYALKYKHSKK